MNNNFTPRSYYLPDLTTEVKKIWPYVHEIWLNDGRIEFSLKKSNQEVEFFSIYQSPKSVENFVRHWVKMGGLSIENERMDQC